MKATTGRTSGLDPMTILGTAAALNAAHETGVLALLAGGPLSARACADRLGLSEHPLQCVLAALVASGLLVCADGLYALPADTSLSTSLEPAMLGALQQHFQYTTQLLRTGTPLPWMDQSEVQRVTSYGNLVSDLGRLYTDLADFLAQKLPRQPASILDIGCGSGVWSLAVAATNDRTRVTGNDLPEVLPAFSARAQRLGLAGRTALLPGDMNRVELPAGQFELVVIANVLRLEPAERAQRLVERGAAALGPGGQMLIIDALAAGTMQKELCRAAYTLHLALRTGLGRVHSPSEIQGWMTAAGLSQLQVIDCGAQMTAIGAIWGVRP